MTWPIFEAPADSANFSGYTLTATWAASNPTDQTLNLAFEDERDGDKAVLHATGTSPLVLKIPASSVGRGEYGINVAAYPSGAQVNQVVHIRAVAIYK